MSETTVVTKTPVETQQITWRIDRFDEIQCDKQLVAQQEFPFELGCKDGLHTSWKFFLKNFREPEESTDWIGVFVKLIKKPEGVNQIFCDFSLQIMDKTGKQYKSFPAKEDEFPNMISNQDWGWYDVFPLKETPQAVIGIDGAVTMVFTLTVINNDVAPIVRKMDLKNHQKFIWRIHNFDEIRYTKAVLEKQAVFYFQMKSPTGEPRNWKVFLRILPFNDINWIGVYLTLVDLSEETILCNMSLKIINKFGQNYAHLDGCARNMFGHVRGWQQVIRQDDDREKLVGEDGTLTLILKVAEIHQEGIHVAQRKKLDLQFECKFKQALSADMSKFLENLNNNQEESSLVATKIVSKDGTTFPVSRDILIARSPVFKPMFQGGTAEHITGLVKINDLSGQALKVLIRFMHAGVLSEEWAQEHVVAEIVYGAHKYLLKDLMEYLDVSVGMVCTSANCATLLCLAVKLGMNKAKEDLLEFCKRNLANMSSEEMVKFLAEEKLDLNSFDEGMGTKRAVTDEGEERGAIKRIKMAE